MREFYMLCNAHLDPVWLWQRQEGMAEAISTFRVAADFCEKYDGFIFNHNESVLYEWVEEYEPALFERIKKLVKEGKWRIMGGWYLQPDCVMPSGETIIRQIEVGNSYFMEKFGVKPVTAINMDPFGHDRGLVQILKKTGYENYLFMRPCGIVPEHNFIWKGYDNSEILAHAIFTGYNSMKGNVIQKIKDFVEHGEEKSLMCWGVGNHGGGPSEEDWQTICKFAEEHPEIAMISSGCEEYFATVDKSKLRTIDKSMIHCMMGCYTTMSLIKRKHRQMENELLLCEKMLAASGVSYDEKAMADAEKALLFSEFHDSLPGTMIKKAEEDMLRLMDSGRETLSRNMVKAFFKLCEGQPAGKRGEIPVLVFNPNPYEIEQEVDVEFILEEQNHTPNQVTLARVRAQDGTYLPAQNVKEECMLNLDWRKKVTFRATLAPMSMNRFDCELYIEEKEIRPITECAQNDTHFLFENEKMSVAINKETGLIDKYNVGGVDYLKEMSAQIRVYDDNEDPWGMTTDGFYNQSGVFTLLSKEEANAFNGYPDAEYENVRVIENGDVITRIQAIFGYGKSYAVVTYTLPKFGDYVDMHIKLLSNDANKMYKLSFPVDMKDSKFVGQTMFGRDELLQNEQEVYYHKWCGMFADGKGFAVLNNGTYGGSAKDDVMNISLLRTPVYSAHPIADRRIADHDRDHDHIDMGQREFDYRLTANIDTLDMQAEVYNQPVYTISFFPSGQGEKKETKVELSNKQLLLTRYEMDAEGKVTARVYNSSDKAQTGTLKTPMATIDIELKPYEFETYQF